MVSYSVSQKSGYKKLNVDEFFIKIRVFGKYLTNYIVLRVCAFVVKFESHSLTLLLRYRDLEYNSVSWKQCFVFGFRRCCMKLFGIG